MIDEPPHSQAFFEALKPVETARLWRYMDFTKYVAMLDSSSLYFARADKFDDPFEGSVSPENIRRRKAFSQGDPSKEDQTNNMSRTHREMRRWMYINCWHESDYESAAMWNQYAPHRGAIAIETTAKLLRAELPVDILLSRVAYHDYETVAVPEGNIYFPFLHKRKSFEHEREVRAVRWKFPLLVKSDIQVPSFSDDNPEEGMTIPVSLSNLIVSVHVSPSAPGWTLDLVTHVTQQYGFSFKVTRSALDSAPVF